MSLVISPTTTSQLDRRAMARMLMKLFDHWQLSADERLDALGLARANRSVLTRFRRGGPIASGRDSLDRAGHLLRIHKNLRLLFPGDRELAYRWIKQHNHAFQNRAPIDVISDYGFAGLLMVRAYLDRAVGR